MCVCVCCYYVHVQEYMIFKLRTSLLESHCFFAITAGNDLT